MFKIDSSTKQINITRGDIGILSISAKNEDGTDYEFQIGDTIRLGIYTLKNYNEVILQKDIEIVSATTNVDLPLTKIDTTIGNIINKPVDYWYEVQLNPDTNPQTIIGHDENGAKIFRLYPEGAKIE